MCQIWETSPNAKHNISFLSLKYNKPFTCWIIFLCNLRIVSDDLRPEQVSSFCTFVSFLFPECCWWCFCNFYRERDKLQKMKWNVHDNSHLQNIRFLSSNQTRQWWSPFPPFVLFSLHFYFNISAYSIHQDFLIL